MPIFATAGSKVYIGQDPLDAKSADFILTDFDSVTWVEIQPVETIGTAGDASEEITFDAIAEARTKTIKGNRRAANLEISAGLDYSDTGQAKLIQAEQSKDNYPIRIVLNDAPSSGAAPTPSERMMVGLVMSAQEQYDNANTVMMLNASIAVNSNIVRKAAATGD